jgi:hypothetical protein
MGPFEAIAVLDLTFRIVVAVGVVVFAVVGLPLWSRCSPRSEPWSAHLPASWLRS